LEAGQIAAERTQIGFASDLKMKIRIAPPRFAAGAASS